MTMSTCSLWELKRQTVTEQLAENIYRVPGMACNDLIPLRKNTALNILPARGSAPLRYIVDGLSRTALIAEKAGYPNTYRDGSVVDPSPWGEGAWAAGEFGAFGKAKVNWSNFPSFYSFHSSGDMLVCVTAQPNCLRKTPN